MNSSKFFKRFFNHFDIDANISLSDVSLDLIHEINQLDPFGQSNPMPILMCSANILDARLVGQTGAHLKCRCVADNAVVDAIGFDLGHRISNLKHKDAKLAFHLTKNTYGGHTTPQLQLIDIQ